MTARILAAFAACAALAAAADPPQVCAEIARPCPGFHLNDLSFPLQRDAPAAAEERSASFLAVILASRPRCSIPEMERLRVQALFPSRKVFSNRFECDGDGENNVRYEGADDANAFMAVYVGASRAEAEELLAQARGMARFPGANIRRMRVVFVHP